MQSNLLLSLLLAATGTSAAPYISSRLSSIPVEIYAGPGCNSSPTPVTTANVPTGGGCFGIAPIISGNTDSALINTNTLTLPAGCSVILYTDNTCSSVNRITITKAGQCFTFGPNLFIHSAKTVGTC